MSTTNNEWTVQALGHKKRLDEYKETLGRLFPSLPKDLVDARSISDVDALILALFLRCYPREPTVLEVGTFFGVSTFHFASQPSVSRVLGVEKELPEIGEAGETSGNLEAGGNPDSLQGLRFIDVARAALAEFADESAKVELRISDVSSAWTTDTPEGAEKMPAQEPSEDQPLLAFISGDRTRETVEADLQAIFGANPRAIAILDHCRGAGGAFVQAGIASFLDGARSKYCFRLFADLTSGVATSNLGIVYPDVDSAELEGCLEELSHLFSDRLDPLWLASREQEMISVVNTYKEEAENLNRQNQDLLAELQQLTGRHTELQKRTSRIEKRKSQLEERVAELKKENKGLQKRGSQLEKRKNQLEERIAAVREEKKALQGRSSRLEQRNSRLEERISRLKEERLLLDAQLSEFRASGRYRLADAVTKNVLRIPGAKSLARRARPEK